MLLIFYQALVLVDYLMGNVLLLTIVRVSRQRILCAILGVTEYFFFLVSRQVHQTMVWHRVVVPAPDEFSDFGGFGTATGLLTVVLFTELIFGFMFVLLMRQRLG